MKTPFWFDIGGSMEFKVFISWSGDRSRMAADALTDWLPKVIQYIRPWMSQVSISKGERWSREVSEALVDQDMGIFCVTPENYYAPWLVFEAGALSTAAKQARVCPLLFGMMPDELEGPLSTFQATVFEKNDFFQLLQNINALLGGCRLSEKVLADVFDALWPSLSAKIRDIMALELKGRRAEIKQVVKVFSRFGFIEPVIGDYASFEQGYESHQLYSIALSLACKRLYIFGRKNRKLFDKEHRDYLLTLPGKIEKGFDLRILFLNPQAPAVILKAAHRDFDIKAQLEKSIAAAVKTLKSVGVDPSKVCRLYSVKRPHGLIVVDDAVLHSPFEYDESGTVLSTTKSAFSVVGAQSLMGKSMVTDFYEVWRHSASLEL
jgi:hypothetical protein